MIYKLIIFIILFSSSSLFLIIDYFGTNVPANEDWWFVEGSYDILHRDKPVLENLINPQGNDHLLFFMRLIFLLSAKYAEWDLRFVMHAGALFIIGALIIKTVYASKTLKSPIASALAASIFLFFTLLPNQITFWLWAETIYIYSITNFFLILLLIVNLSKLNHYYKFIFSAVLSLCAILSTSYGFIGLILVPLLWIFHQPSNRKTTIHLVICWCALIAAILTTSYLIFSSIDVPIDDQVSNRVDYLISKTGSLSAFFTSTIFFFSLLGMPFLTDNVSINFLAMYGLLVLLSFFFCCYQIISKKRIWTLDRKVLFWLFLGFLNLSCLALISLGRGSYGLGHLSGRYIFWVLHFYSVLCFMILYIITSLEVKHWVRYMLSFVIGSILMGTAISGVDHIADIKPFVWDERNRRAALICVNISDDIEKLILGRRGRPEISHSDLRKFGSHGVFGDLITGEQISECLQRKNYIGSCSGWSISYDNRLTLNGHAVHPLNEKRMDAVIAIYDDADRTFLGISTECHILLNGLSRDLFTGWELTFEYNDIDLSKILLFGIDAQRSEVYPISNDLKTDSVHFNLKTHTE